MKEYIITIDAGSTLNIDDCNKYNIIPLRREYIFNDKVFKDNLNTNEYSLYYKNVRKGIKPTLLNINQYVYLDFWYKYLLEGKQILHFSIGSKEYKSACQAKSTFEEMFNKKVITIINPKNDIFSAGILAIEASRYRAQSQEIEVVLEKIIQRIDDLKIYDLDNKSKKSLGINIKNLKNICTNQSYCYIVHSDNIMTAKKYGKILKNKYGINNIKYSYVSPYKIDKTNINQLKFYCL